MNFYQQGFREDILNTIFKLTTKTWLKITGVHAIQTLITVVLALIILMPVMINNLSLGDLASSMDSPEAILSFYSELFETLTQSTSIILALIAFVIVVFFIYSWAMYLQIKMSDAQIKSGVINFAKEFKMSFNGQVLRVLGAFILVYLISVGLFFIAGATATLSGLLAFILGVGAILVIIRLILVIPALVLADRTVGEAFAWSFQNVTWLRALKILGISILAMLIIFTAAIIIGLISAIFAIIPVLGQLIQFAVNIFMGGFIAALSTSAILSLYYRYAEDIKESENEDNIKLDDLLVSDN